MILYFEYSKSCIFILVKEKNWSIESARYIAAFAVICIHYFYPKNETLTLVVNQCARFAVPFFFTVSGYFLAEKLKGNDRFSIYWKYVKKIFFLYIAWQFIYFIDPPYGEIYIRGFWKAYSNKLHQVTDQNWEYIIFKGWSQHLWYFASLCLTVIYFFLFRLKRVYLMVGISALLYMVGALTHAYARSRLGIPTTWLGLPPKFNTNNLIFFSAFPFSLGVLLSARPVHIGLWPSIIILLLGVALHFTEIWFLGHIKLKQRVDYGFTTFIMGVGVFLVAKNHFKPLEWKALASLGKFSLGIYAMHVLVATYLYNYLFIHYKDYLYITRPMATLIACTLITWGMSKVPVLKKLV